VDVGVPEPGDGAVGERPQPLQALVVSQDVAGRGGVEGVSVGVAVVGVAATATATPAAAASGRGNLIFANRRPAGIDARDWQLCDLRGLAKLVGQHQTLQGRPRLQQLRVVRDGDDIIDGRGGGRLRRRGYKQWRSDVCSRGTRACSVNTAPAPQHFSGAPARCRALDTLQRLPCVTTSLTSLMVVHKPFTPSSSTAITKLPPSSSSMIASSYRFTLHNRLHSLLRSIVIVQ
jgi:hypothetical protein